MLEAGERAELRMTSARQFLKGTRNGTMANNLYVVLTVIQHFDPISTYKTLRKQHASLYEYFFFSLYSFLRRAIKCKRMKENIIDFWNMV